MFSLSPSLTNAAAGVTTPSFYGRGLAFPRQLDENNARPLIASNEALILMSMDQIINTGILERPFLVRNGVPYGTRVREILFDSADAAISIIKFDVKRALDTWEPRIIVSSVEADETLLQNGSAAIVASTYFSFRSTNRADNFVSTFLINKGQS